MIEQINETSTDYASSKNIYELFEETVANHPNANAVSTENEQVTYIQLKEKVDRLATHLSNLGVKHEENVVIVADKSIETIVGIIAILKIGAAYVPVNRNYPEEFLENIIEDCKSKYILCVEDLAGFDHLKKININREFEEVIQHTSYSISPQDKAYVMYTSGSTGKSKGVVVTHRNIIRLINNTNIIDFKREDVILQTGSITFDASTFEIWGALLNGIELYLVDEDVLLDIESIRMVMAKSKVTIMWVSAPLFNKLVEIDETIFRDVRTLLVGGDVVSPKMTNKVRRHSPGIVIINGYGPTENTTFSTFFKVDRNYETSIPIGKPIANSTAYVVNEKMQLQPFGVIGELVVGGDGVAEGYLNKHELTEQQFIANPFDSSGRLYKTGDYARLNEEGNIEFIGRIDKQVKVRGFRIELQAIEQAIRTIIGVDQVLVNCVEDEDNKRIIAYYTGESSLDILDILDEMLPDYMLPHHIIHMKEIPLSKNGKVDYSKLPKTSELTEESVKSTHVLPKTEDEKVLFEIWKEILQTDAFGITDNFFKLGGDSIMVIQLTNMVKKAGYHVTTKMVFQNQTIRSLAGQLTKINKVIEDEVVTGEGELGPIQQWFFNQGMKNKHFWNLPLIIHFDQKHESEIIHKALHEVVIYHESLHSTFVETEHGVVQVYGDKSVNLPFEIVDLTNVNDREEVIKQKSIACQEKINIENGPLVSGVLFNDQEKQYLFIGVHHLVVDGVSLRIIGEDLLHAVEQLENHKQIQLQPKSTSFKQWTERLKEYANSKQAISEYEYWKAINDNSKNFINLEGVNQENTSKTMYGKLDQETTDLLLKKAGLNLGAEINDLFLASLFKTFKDLFGVSSLSLKVEGHGREDIIPVDLSRTVGWFTTAYPILLESSNDESIENLVLGVKDILRKIPNKGIGYGILRYLSDHEEVLLDFEPEISFNYLGNFDEKMEVASRKYGIFHDETAKRDVVLDFNIVLFRGEMIFYLTLHDELIKDKRFKILLETYIQNTKIITQTCGQLEEKIYSASDFPLANVGTKEVQNIMSEYQNKVKDLYSLSVAQKGMLYHYLMNSKSEEYFGQIHCQLYGNLNKDRFTEAWNHVVRNNPILSTVYKWEEMEDPVQIVLENERLDVRYINAKEIEQLDEGYLEKLLQEDKENRFELTSLPVIRIMVVEMKQHIEFVFSFHHISLDGWSVFVILNEVIETYKQLTNREKVLIGHEKGQYKDYIEWLQEQDKVEVESFWSQYMKGFEQKNWVWGVLPEKNEMKASKFKQQTIELTKAEEVALNKRSEEIGVTVNTLLQSALAIILHKFSGSQDIVFGTTVSGRDPNIEQVNSITGLLINTIPLRVQMDMEAEIHDYIQFIQQNAFEINNYHMLSMAEIKSVSDIDHADEFFDVLLIFENYPIAEQISDRNNEISFGRFESHERTNYALTIVAVPEETLKIRYSYMDNEVDEDTIHALMKGMKTVLMNLCTSEGTVSHISIDEEDYEHNVLHEWSRNATIKTLYEDQEEIYSVVMNSEYDAQIFILDKDLKPTSLGIPGEVYIAIKDINIIESDWTDWMKENKIENEISSDSYDHLYKTGDIGMWISKGKIRLLE
ncbi:non-ribosomal peptide synthetase [Virgibacillus sp. Bac330]|uniref:non-ribosomal peptide synthetase n=1 Tax=Virgibacillus sp. Bac330 TaxID=2419841 RepID=UPI000EF4CF9E|nr:non-ribosomal peptide synthetase [Virgibacillus sp. Bac330]